MTTENAKIQGQAIKDVAEDEDIVTPWIVTSTSDTGIDYDKLISKSIALYILQYINNYSQVI